MASCEYAVSERVDNTQSCHLRFFVIAPGIVVAGTPRLTVRNMDARPLSERSTRVPRD